MLPALFPTRRWLSGPVALRHIARAGVVYTGVALTGVALHLFAQSMAMQIFGLGLILPGGGFLAHADMTSAAGLMHIALAVAGALSFIAAGIAWFATGNAIAPPATWLFLAVAASRMQHAHNHAGALTVVLCLVGGGGLVALLFGVWRQWRGGKKRRAANDWLKNEALGVAEGFQAMPPPAAFSHDDARRMRFLLDRALQPVSEFNGFEWLDQFQTGAVRYQINFMGYALSMAQATRLPAFSGYINQAQRHLIEKLADHRVWRYWALENLWGNGRLDPNPIARENIMYTGFCATQMAMHHASSGVRTFAQAGSFPLHHPSGKTWDCALPALLHALDREMTQSAFHLIACEPNWIYPLCNAIGAAAMKADAGDIWARHEHAFRQNLEHEFIDLSGRFVPCRSRYTGLALPVIGGAMPQALPCFFLNATLPDVALRQWLLLRRDITQGNRLRREKFWRIDTGNYRFFRASAYASVALTAGEMGDEEVKRLCLDALEEECPMRTDDGHFYRPTASVFAHAMEFFARSSVRGGFRTLIHTPPNLTPQPHVHHAAYPDVLVAGATYADGRLQATFYPSCAASRQTIELAGLIPDALYICQGAEEDFILANKDGHAALHVILDGRRDVAIRRQE